MIKKELSIIVPIYNKENYIKDCIESVLLIKEINYELILIDDGSKDRSLDIVKKYEKRNNVKILIKENGGASSARNLGIKNSTGKYLMFLDADDLINAEEFENFYKKGSKENVDIIFGNYNDFNGNIQNIKKDKRMQEIEKLPTLNGKEYFKFLDKKGLYNMIICKNLYKKDFLIRENIWWKEGIIFEDEIFSYITLNRAKRVKYIDKYFYFYRKNSMNSVMKGMNNKLKDYMKVSETLSEEFLKNDTVICMKKIPIIFYLRAVKKTKIRDKKIENKIFKLKGIFFYKLRKKIEILIYSC